MGREGRRAPKGKPGRGLRASGFLVWLGPITLYREVLTNLAGKLREEAAPRGLPVPIFEQKVNEYGFEVEKRATLGGATDETHPPDYDTGENVAVALKADGRKSVDSCMTELRLWNGEVKHESPAGRTRLLYRDRPPLNRGNGPAAEALERQFEDPNEDAKLSRARSWRQAGSSTSTSSWTAPGSTGTCQAAPAREMNRYDKGLVAVRRMLRGVEVSASKRARGTRVEGEVIAVLFSSSCVAGSGGTGTSWRPRCTRGQGGPLAWWRAPTIPASTTGSSSSGRRSRTTA